MNAKEIKSALKEVKEHLDANDAKSAIKQCKNILKSDRNNYMAMVFLGVALQETEQKAEAPKAFKKAIEISPGQLLAWRGLVSFYEKTDPEVNKRELFHAYENVIKLENDTDKLTDLSKKVVNQAKEDLMFFVDSLYEYLPQCSDEKNNVVKQLIVSVLSSVPLSDDIVEKLFDWLPKLASTNESEQSTHWKLCVKWLEQLYKLGQLLRLLDAALIMKNIYPKRTFPLSWYCKIYSKLVSQGASLNNCKPEEVYSELLLLDPQSDYGYACKGCWEFVNKDFILSEESLVKSVQIKASETALVVLCQCREVLHYYYDLESSALTCLQLTKKQQTKERCQRWQLVALVKQEDESKWVQAFQLGVGVLNNGIDQEVCFYVAKALVNLKRYKECFEYSKHCEQSKALLIEALTTKDESIEKCSEKLQAIVNKYPNFGEAWLELGKVQYGLKHVDALSSFLKAAKLDEWCYWCFVYLGHSYKDLIRDLDKARRCYQKAYQLNPKDPTTVICLSDLYRAVGHEELNLELLSTVTSHETGSKWAWLRLGLHYLSTNQNIQAVNSLKAAVRLDANDKHCWESLGDAYLAQGAFTSALKSYQRVAELDPSSIYPPLQIATVKLMMTDFVESVAEFRSVLTKEPEYVPALKGHAEACLALAGECLRDHLDGRAVDLCEEAVTSLLKGVKKRGDLLCLWKLLGDACSMLYVLPEKCVRFRVSSALLNLNGGECHEGTTRLNKVDVMKLGTRSYCHALTLQPTCAELWFDLAFIYNALAECGRRPAGKKQMREMAMSAVKKSLTLSKQRWQTWNLMGVIATAAETKDLKLAQHCFIRALDIEDMNPVAWTNIGTLYLMIEDLQLANQAFSEAQRCDPDYVPCWVGQALIAEAMSHHDAMDLFRHSTHLGIHPEGCLGYASMVCSTLAHCEDPTASQELYSIKNMNAIPVAADALVRYTDRILTNACAFNMLGLLLERQGLNNRCVQAFKRALDLVESNRGEEEALDQVLLNYGRALVRIGQFEEAVQQLKRIKEATFVNQCGISEAYFKAGLYEEAYNSYETTLKWLAQDDAVKSQILVAMASVVYLHQGQQDAQILLVQACQLKPASIHGLYACCALGMLHSDLSFSEMALKGLAQHSDTPQHLSNVALFQAYFQLFKGRNKEAVRSLSQVAHRHPQYPELWLSLSLLLLHLHPDTHSKTAGACAKITMNTGRSTIDVSKVMSLVSLSDLLAGEGKKSVSSAQIAVHTHPNIVENWIVLIAAIMSKCLKHPHARDLLWLKKLITHVRRKLETSKQVTNWLSNNDRKISLMVDTLLDSK